MFEIWDCVIMTQRIVPMHLVVWSLRLKLYQIQYRPGPPGRLSALSAFRCKSVFYDGRAGRLTAKIGGFRPPRAVHAATGEVYDPRDKTTGKPFTFPDVDDLVQHYEERIAPREAELKRKRKDCAELRTKMLKANREEETLTPAAEEGFRSSVAGLHGELLAAEHEVEHEKRIATKVGSYPTVTLQYSSTTLYQFCYHIQHLCF
jgi:hypothetical protein